jgi:hypothetical protein
MWLTYLPSSVLGASNVPQHVCIDSNNNRVIACNTRVCWEILSDNCEDALPISDGAHGFTTVDGHWYGYGSLCEEVLCNPQCPFGEIADRNGNCAPISWLSDGYCDNGTFEWSGNPIFFDCPEFLNDLGDCN